METGPISWKKSIKVEAEVKQEEPGPEEAQRPVDALDIATTSALSTSTLNRSFVESDTTFTIGSRQVTTSNSEVEKALAALHKKFGK